MKIRMPIMNHYGKITGAKTVRCGKGHMRRMKGRNMRERHQEFLEKLLRIPYDKTSVDLTVAIAEYQLGDLLFLNGKRKSARDKILGTPSLRKELEKCTS